MTALDRPIHQRHQGRRRSAVIAVALATVLVVGTQSAGASGSRQASEAYPRPNPTPPVQVLQTGLSSPHGLDSLFGIPIVSQGAFGAPGPVVAVVPTRHGSAQKALSEPIQLTGVAIGSMFSIWGLGSDQILYRKTMWDPAFKPVANIAEYQLTDPDPDNAADSPTESNPYAVAALPNGDALVADAANNDLLRITPRGHVRTVATFSTQLISTDHIPADPNAPLPPFIPAEAVPTSIAVTPRGVLVGELKGFPFRAGSSHVWLVDPDARGAVCSPASPSTSGCRLFASGFTAIQSVAYNSFTRDLYVLELAEGGVMAFEEGGENGQAPPAVLLEVNRRGDRRELAKGQIFEPGGVTMAGFNSLFVTDGLFNGPGRLLRVSTR